MTKKKDVTSKLNLKVEHFHQSQVTYCEALCFVPHYLALVTKIYQHAQWKCK